MRRLVGRSWGVLRSESPWLIVEDELFRMSGWRAASGLRFRWETIVLRRGRPGTRCVRAVEGRPFCICAKPRNLLPRVMSVSTASPLPFAIITKLRVPCLDFLS
ncbi:hypothetical protein P175DRAFT_0223382 [Aspergillus ochraceoroseus IBT 24754]|uniref:Uncharacterized protein n=1 Tax=Aspergillus ochraceoroseus IBT 24754 TaxID=1392256 RepID=A0A2T5LWC7_9EURO|nr:uncharacterized protein P175DRAFT_0223382 [Aspergillus ochraceoroseus IBT 24754]PTU20590.1 hypothetical protein P175DRAFT_0223382 [Aspergillus ochraceoroseus IBT 24754]